MSVAYGETGLEVRHIVVKRTIIEILSIPLLTILERTKSIIR